MLMRLARHVIYSLWCLVRSLAEFVLWELGSFARPRLIDSKWRASTTRDVFRVHFSVPSRGCVSTLCSTLPWVVMWSPHVVARPFL